MVATPPEYSAQTFGGPDITAAPGPVFGGEAAGKLAVLTGGGGSLGAALGRALADDGADIALIGQDQNEMDRVIASFGKDARALSLRCDLASESDISGAVEFIQRLDRPVDYLIHAAGVQSPATIAWSSVAGLDEHYLWNVRAPYLFTQKLLPMLSARSGRVAFFVAPDHEGGVSSGGDVHHRISNAGLESLAKELRVEADKMGIRVLTVTAPVAVRVGAPIAATSSGENDPLRAFAVEVARAMVVDEIDVTELSLQSPSGTRGVRQS